MIRFRFVEDEKRFLRLLSEIYRQCATHLPPATLSSILRNFGKLQDLLMLEGVRQGVAVAELGLLIDESSTPFSTPVRELKAFPAHAAVYGSSDTPLHSVELEWFLKLGVPPEAQGAWLDAKPMRFAPETEFEAIVAMRQPPSSSPPRANSDDLFPGDDGNLFIQDLLGLVARQGVPESGAQNVPAEEPVEYPATLDQIRDALKTRIGGGWQPTSWTDLVMGLHLALSMDAGFIDLTLSTPMGQTVLAQCGIHDLSPGAGFDLTALSSSPDGNG